MTEYTIKGIKVTQSKSDMIEDLLQDKYGYSHICKCGKEQTGSSLYEILKHNHNITEDYICKDCSHSTPVEYMGKLFPSIKAAADANWTEDLKCPRCGSPISYGAFYQKIQRGWSMECHSCISSDVMTEVNKYQHDYLSERMTTWNYEHWSDPEYRKMKSESARETFSKLWSSTEKGYGPNGDMTYAEFRSWYPSSEGPGNVFNSEFMYELWSNPEFYNYRVNLFNSNDHKSWSATGFRRNLLESKDYLRSVVNDLYKDYDDMFGKVDIIYMPIELRIIATNFSSLNLKYDRYVDYCIKKEITINSYGNHHVLPNALFDWGYDDVRMSVDVKTHSMLHYLMVLDNLERFTYTNDEEFTKYFLKLVYGLMARYHFGYKRYVNNNSLTEENNQLTPYLLKTIEMLFC